MLSPSRLFALAICVAGCSGEVIAVKLKNQEPNPNGYFTCQPAEGSATFTCASGQAFHQSDRELLAGEPCPYGLASIQVETSSSGKVTRVQYACALAPIGDFPPDPGAAAPAAPAPAPAPVPAAPPPAPTTGPQ